MINKERILNQFMEFIRVYSPTKNERRAADLAIKYLKELNMEVLEDNVGELIGGNSGNVIAYLKGKLTKAPVLLLSAHLDCVQPCENIEPELIDGIIKSKSNTILGGDDKAGIVSILEALKVIKEKDIPHGDIQVVFTVAEEGGLAGSKNIDTTLLKADLGYALDSSGKPGTIINNAPGQNRIEITVQGKAAHAGIAPEEGINAIMVTAKALSQVRDGRIDEETTANIGIIKGGTATNIVTDKVEIIGEARSRNLDKLTEQTNHVCEAFNKVAQEHGATVDFKVIKSYEPYFLTEEMPVVSAAVEAAKNIGLPFEIKATGGGSDANYFNSHGIPCAVLGIGMEKVHTTEEYIKEEHLYQTAEYVVSIIKSVAESDQSRNPI